LTYDLAIMDALDQEIYEWVLFAKGDFLGHLFHGNQFDRGGGGTATVPRRSDAGRNVVSPDRYGNDLSEKADELAKNPTPEGHEALAKAHAQVAGELHQLASQSSGTKASYLEHAAIAHENASLAHETAAHNYSNPITSKVEGYNQNVSQQAIGRTQVASERTDFALGL
jgi:hypothetical protein